ncbi:MAG: hypothetical protein Tsb002_08750 [Wenzhouxiangellaceae bacterium]
MADVTGKVVMIKMKIQYTNGEEKIITIPPDEAQRIGALVLDEGVYGKICDRHYDAHVKKGFTEYKTDDSAPEAFSNKQLKNTMVVVYKDDDVLAACGGDTHPPHW